MTIELGYEIYQLRSAQCRNQGKILQCYFHVHECNYLFFFKMYHSMPFFKNQVPYKFAYIALPFIKLYIELFWQNSSTKCGNVALYFWRIFFHPPLDIQYFWEKYLDMNRTLSPSVKFCFLWPDYCVARGENVCEVFTHQETSHEFSYSLNSIGKECFPDEHLTSVDLR